MGDREQTVPIEFDDNQVDTSGVDDRRGGGSGLGGGGLAIGGGTGIVGIVIFVLFQLLGGSAFVPIARRWQRGVGLRRHPVARIVRDR